MSISKKSRTRALISAAVVGVALTGVAVTSASANHTGTFVPKSDLPQASQYTPWTAQAPKAGLPKPMYTCIKGILPAGKSSYQTFSGDLAAEVREIITVAKNKTEAKALAAKLRSAIANCDDKLDDVTDIDRIGRFKTADGLTLDAVYTAPEGSEYNFQLFAVGRDGRAVVVTTFSDMGQEDDAPIAAFTTTAKRALQKAF
ncbi:hypothetical protein [Sporichthya sp.]|uniref:hypothetical protein n=1 Tax=Sporichthya sp. TaxID=65475 RepID=UPI00182FBC58|nr:hypothetical protein [Sporichthya sp.]MBA3745265.1 hypothetical protein [Sporichthya sp.]